jgi:Spy/CpxP family protein refolding chaperone
MKLEMNSQTKRTALIGIALIVGLGYGGRVLFPADAKEFGTAGLIDADWENCLRKHVEKRFFHLIEAREDQQKTLDALFKSRMEVSRPTRETLREGAVELAQLFASSDATDEQIEQKSKQLRALHEKLSDERIETALKVRGILDADQKKVLSDRITALLTGNEPPRLRRGF